MRMRRAILISLTIGISGCAGAEVKQEAPTVDPGFETLRKACLQEEGDNQEHACRKLLRLRPKDPEAEHRLGWLLTCKGKEGVPEGVAHLRLASTLQPDNPEVWFHLGAALEKREDSKGAEGAYLKAIQLKPDYTYARVARGILLRRTGDEQGAKLVLEEVVKLDPESATGWAQLSLTLAKLDKLEEAIETGLKAVELKPDDDNARSNLGLFLTDAGRVEEGLEQLRRAVALNPKNSTAMYNLGLAYTKADALEEAVQAYHRALLIEEKFPRAHHNLAVILIGLGLCQESKRHFDRSHEMGIKTVPIVLKQYKALCEAAPEESQEAGEPETKNP